MVPCKRNAKEVSFEWSHHRISSTDSKVRTTLHVSIIDSKVRTTLHVSIIDSKVRTTLHVSIIDSKVRTTLHVSIIDSKVRTTLHVSIIDSKVRTTLHVSIIDSEVKWLKWREWNSSLKLLVNSSLLLLFSEHFLASRLTENPSSLLDAEKAVIENG